ncbi:MAG: glycoside hydrolase family 55 protein, partial [Muribaculaceae bacterium]|nr:glycoside hydrolase family 55 protein [Muribaculaceae bacterium]
VNLGMIKPLMFAAAVVSASAVYGRCRISPCEKGYVVVTDYLQSVDVGCDVSDAIQKVIDDNPNRTIYFPDGTYVISKPIVTPADPTKSVALELSNYAVIKAASGWDNAEAMIRLGGKEPANDITTPGSNYYFSGGVVDGSGRAKGISVDGGRETVIRDASIKNVSLGIHIKLGANSGSSDADVHDVNITGNCTPECVGVLVEGHDNTFTNMRIGGVNIGFLIRSAANCLRNIHPLYYSGDDGYDDSCGFVDEDGCNWYDFCYSDEFATAFRADGDRSLFNNCYAYWYSSRGRKHVGFSSKGVFNSAVMNFHMGLSEHNRTAENKILEAGEPGGSGSFSNLHIVDDRFVTDFSHENYVK